MKFRSLLLPLPARRSRRAGATVALALAAALGAGCASVPNPNPKDPLEGFNRGVQRFNDAVDEAVLVPVATTYRDTVPQPLRTGLQDRLFHRAARTPQPVERIDEDDVIVDDDAIPFIRDQHMSVLAPGLVFIDDAVQAGEGDVDLPGQLEGVLEVLEVEPDLGPSRRSLLAIVDVR